MKTRAVFVAFIVVAMAAGLTACDRSRSGSRGASGAARFGLGRSATIQEVGIVDIAIRPDGTGLPAGRGSTMYGAMLFQQKCASCHGVAGQGMPPAYPALVGRDPKGEGFNFASDPRLVRTIGNYWPNATTLFDYIRRAMPFPQPGSLTDEEVYALTAWLLAANKVIPDSSVLDAGSLRQVKMPYADRFVPDDRRGGRTVK